MNPATWVSLKVRSMDLAEIADAWRIFPRFFVFSYLYELDAITKWYMAKPDPTAAQTTFTTAVWGFLIPVLTWYFSTGRRWEK
jgi:hypothetical protein